MLFFKKTPVFWLVVMLASVMVLTACGGGGQPEDEEVEEEPEEQPEEADEEPEEAPVVTISGDILLDPANASGDDAEQINVLVYDTLIVDGEDGIEPGLAIDWLPSEDELDWIFTLRSNAVFHDGTPVDADAVLANFNRWFDPDDPLRGGGDYVTWEASFGGFLGEDDPDGVPFSSFDGIEKVDATTVLIHLTRPEPDLTALLSDPAFSIVNPAAIEANIDSYGTQDSNISGSGAYVIETWDDTSLELSEFEAYYGEAPAAAQSYVIE